MPTPDLIAGDRTFTFLGTGTSVGVPMIACDCPVCRSTNPRNHRYRCSVLIGTPAGNILIDTGPELRLQLVRERVKLINAVLYTHYHVDHLFGLDDLRVFPPLLRESLPIYCNAETEGVIRRAFSYVFDSSADQSLVGLLPKLEFQRIQTQPFRVLDELVTPIPLIHGRFHVLGFRIGDAAYCTDVSHIPDSSIPLLQGLKVLVLDALKPGRSHPSHFGLDDALAMVARLKPQRAYFTHMAHTMDYETIMPTLPAGVELAYDGLTFRF